MGFKKGNNVGKQFQPGQSGNPDGPAPGYVQAKTLLKRLLALEIEDQNPLTGMAEKMPLADHLHLRQIKKALHDSDTRAYAEIFDRVDGRPTQTLAGDPDNPLIPGQSGVSALSVEDVEKIAAILNRNAGA